MFAMNSKTHILAIVVTTAHAWRAAESRHALRKGEDILMKTVRLKHFRAALLAAAAGLLAAVGLVVVLYTQPAEANYPGKLGKIAFAGYERNDSEIYTIKPDGGGKVPLTDNKAGNYQPAYSPNGKRIAYVGFDGTDYEIYTINVGGGDKLNVTNNSTDDYDPDYAPNGKRIAYTNNVSGGDEEIYTINASGGGELNVTDNDTGDFYPSYSPSGNRIAFVNDAGADREIYTIKPNGGVSTKSSTTPRPTLILTGAVNSDFSLRVALEV